MGKKNKKRNNLNNENEKNKLPFVSVCTPTFNRRPFWEYTIKCFKHQNYPSERVEWIIIDDGTDLIEDLVCDISQVKYFKYTEKMTLGKKRNLMHEKSIGDIIVFIEDDDYSDGIVTELGLQFENGNIKQCKTQKLRLIEPDQDRLDIPNVEFSSILNMPSSDFQKIIRDMANISDKIEIKSSGNELLFSACGQFARAEIRRSETIGSMEFIQKKNSHSVIQGEFSLKNLLYFIKCTNLCSQIEIYLENNLPLIVKYNVASLGEIRLCLSPIPSNKI